MNVKFSYNKNIFILFLALCASGKQKKFSYTKKVSSLYKKIQNDLSKDFDRDFNVLKDFFEQEHPAEFVIWVLSHTELPEYKIVEYKGDLDRKFFLGFDKEFVRFYNIYFREYFKIVKSVLEKQRNKMKKDVKYSIDKLNSYVDTSNIKNFVIIPAPLSIAGSYGIKIGKDAFFVARTLRKKSSNYSQLIIHEFLHSVVNPKTRSVLDRNADSSEVIVNKFLVRTYPKLWMIINEYLIRSLEFYLINKSVIIDNNKKLGFKLIEEVVKLADKPKKIDRRFIIFFARKIEKFIKKSM